MGWNKFKILAVCGAGTLIFFFFLSFQGVDVFGNLGRLKLPVGPGKPAISLGERHGLILAADGSLWTWGSDLLGWPVLGLGTNTMKSTVLRRIGHETNWVNISAGEDRSLAIKSDGTLWTWGEGTAPQFGRLVAIYTPTLAAPGNDWAQASAGGNISIGLKKNGTLWSWGNNWAGTMGVPDAKFGSLTPLQVGSSTNWVKVWAGLLETVALQSDGSLWYWGENPNPSFAQTNNQIFSPTRVGRDTNWVDVGFGVNTVFAIKADGTLWAWGRHAEQYTGSTNFAQNEIPTRIGTNSDWQSFAATTGWWITGLSKKDGSLWFMDASGGSNNTPPKNKPVQFRRIEFPKKYAAFAAGALHAAPPGVHGPIAVILTDDGEVWTSGMVMGDPPTLKSRCLALGAKLAQLIRPRKNIGPPEPDPIYRNQPWQLRNREAD